MYLDELKDEIFKCILVRKGQFEIDKAITGEEEFFNELSIVCQQSSIGKTEDKSKSKGKTEDKSNMDVFWEGINEIFIDIICPVYGGYHQGKLMETRLEYFKESRRGKKYKTREYKAISFVSFALVVALDFEMRIKVLENKKGKNEKDDDKDVDEMCDSSTLERLVNWGVKAVYGAQNYYKANIEYFEFRNEVSAALDEYIKEIEKDAEVKPDKKEEKKQKKKVQFKTDSLKLIYALLIAATQKKLMEDESVSDARKKHEIISWFFDFDRRIPKIKFEEQEMKYSEEDKRYVEERIVRYIWDESNHRNIFDHHSSISEREGGVILSEYYVVPALDCKDKDEGFILDRKGNIPVRNVLCSPSGYGKSTLFEVLLHTCTLDLAKKYGVVSESEELAYREIQDELVGNSRKFPQFLPVVVTASMYQRTAADDFIDLFAQELFPVDELTPQGEVERKKHYANVYRKMVATHKENVLFFVDAFDEIQIANQKRFIEKLAELSCSEKKWNILLSYRPFLNEGLLSALPDWKDYKKWRISPLDEWGKDIHGHNKLWLMIRRYTDYVACLDVELSEHYADLLFDRMQQSQLLKVFGRSPYLTAWYTATFFENGEYKEKTDYEIIENEVYVLLKRFNYKNEKKSPLLKTEEFMMICARLALYLLKTESTAIPASRLSTAFNKIDLVFGKDDFSLHFADPLLCEDINVKSGVLILEDNQKGYEFQGHQATLPFLAAQAFCSELAELYAEKDYETAEGKIEEMLGDLAEIHPEYWVFIPMVIVALYDRGQNPYQYRRVSGRTQRRKLAETILQVTKESDFSEECKEKILELINDRRFTECTI